MTKNIILGVITLIVVLVVSIQIYRVYWSISKPPSNSPSGNYVFNVEQGETYSDLSKTLVEDNILPDGFAFMYTRFAFDVNPLQQGVYTLQVPSSPEDIISQINNETQRLADENAAFANNPSVTITFREGLIADQVFALLEKNGLYSVEEYVEYAQKPDNFDTQLYPFLPDPLDCTYGDMSMCAKYYIEGYLYPDTYTFFTSSTINEIFNKFLLNFQAKVWQPYSREIESPESLYQTLITASVIELETGRTKGITPATQEEVQEERRNMATVFKNRDALGMKWQSDPTVSYGTGFTVCQQTFDIEGCVFLDDPRVATLYNTYAIDGAPIGPVTSPQSNNIAAVLDPLPNNFLFFVSDVIGRKYFSETENEHIQTIEEVKTINVSLQ